MKWKESSDDTFQKLSVQLKNIYLTFVPLFVFPDPRSTLINTTENQSEAFIYMFIYLK